MDRQDGTQDGTRAGRRRALATAVVALVALLGALLPAAPALAHDTGGGSGSGPHPGASPEQDEADAAAHAEQDLVGVGMDEIEAGTAARREALDLPVTTRREVMARTAAEQPGATAGDLGRWSPVQETDVVPVFSAVLPSGRVLMWDSVGTSSVDRYDVHDHTRAAVWDPVAQTSRRVDVQGYNIFCAGFVHLSDGNVLVVGGNKNAGQEGIRQTHVFDWRSETWTRGPDMDAERWYPSVAALADGRALVVAGEDPVGGQPDPTHQDHAEVYETSGTFRPLIGFDAFSHREYPFLVPRPDSGVEVVGPSQYLDRYDTTGDGASTRTTVRDGVYRNVGSFATYDEGLTLVAGGGQDESTFAPRPERSAVVVDTSQPGRTTVRRTGSLSVPRRQHHLTALADGSVLATGGMNSPTETLVDLAPSSRVDTAERWDPATGRWTVLAAATRARQYHSSAVLLPDGRVMTGGGGVCGDCMRAGYLEKNVEYFSPPYLFDASGAPAVRPVLTSVPAQLDLASTATFSSSSAPSIAEVGLVRLGAETHGVDQGQRWVPLEVTTSGTTVTVQTPRTAALAPPGWYMLFATTRAGVPSVASMVHVGPTWQTPGTTTGDAPVTSPTPGWPVAPGTTPVVPVVPGATAQPGPPTCLEAPSRGRAGRLVPVVRWACTGAAAQTWTRQRSDASLRAVGRCLTFGRDRAVGPRDPVLLGRCQGAGRQRVLVRGDTLRPAAAPRLCVSSTGDALRPGERLRLLRCDGSARQRWTARPRA